MPLLLKNSYKGVWFVKYRGTFIKVIPIIDVVLVLSLQKSSRPEVFFKKGLLQTFVKFRCEPATLLKKRLWHRYFPVNFANFQEHFFYKAVASVYIYFTLFLLFLLKTFSRQIFAGYNLQHNFLKRSYH